MPDQPVDPTQQDWTQDPYYSLAQDLYESLMKAVQTITFDTDFTAADMKHAAETCIRARRMLGISPDFSKVKPHE